MRSREKFIYFVAWFLFQCCCDSCFLDLSFQNLDTDFAIASDITSKAELSGFPRDEKEKPY